MGLHGEPPLPDLNPETAYLPVDGVARRIHSDLPAMIIGGLASLLLQMNHPAAMAGVAQFSMYKKDPLGRLYQTAQFLGTTTFGSRSDALAVIDTVRDVHEGVRGTTHQGEPYWANDPRTLLWVHCAETAMFLRAAELYGPRVISSTEADQYVNEMAQVARDLGTAEPPTTREELFLILEGFRPELELSDAGRDARNFVIRGVHHRPVELAGYATLCAAAINILPAWGRELLGIPKVPLVENLAVRPTALAAAVAMRLAIPGAPTAST
jgi:uncharacterized protein (DUF2236 family)